MRIVLNEIPINDIVLYNKETKEYEGFTDNEEEGVYGMGGKLNIRPIYQREFIYKEKEKESVINTLRNNFPLNVLYWMENKNDSYEVLDGQQRLISICTFIYGVFSVEWPGLGRVYFHNLSESQQDQILNYKLMVYFCEGSDNERLNWFQTINIAGLKLTDQEIKNAIFSGPWVGDAKKYFSKVSGPAYQLAHKYLNGSSNRQDYLETAIKWISKEEIQEYMALNQHKENAEELWQYFVRVIEWVESIFAVYRKEMKGLPFGLLYNKYKDYQYNSTEVEVKVSQLMIDEDVENKKGIYLYIFDGDEKQLHIRLFSDKQKRETYEKQKRICVHCKENFKIEQMEGDHITSWAKGGHTVSENCQMLCIKCNREKGSK